MERAVIPILLAMCSLSGCVIERQQPPVTEAERAADHLTRLAAEDASLAAKLELDPSGRMSWWTRPGRGDDPSRRIRFDPGPLALILYPSTLLELPGTLLGIPGSLF